jgi:phage shock protein C
MVDEYAYSRNPKRLYRSREKIIAGVCGGIADRMGWDATIVRLAFAVLFFTGILSAVFIIYIVVWAITPYAPYRSRHLTPDEERFWSAASDRPAETFSNVRYKFKDLDDRLANMERIVTSEEYRLKRQFRDLEGS